MLMPMAHYTYERIKPLNEARDIERHLDALYNLTELADASKILLGAQFRSKGGLQTEERITCLALLESESLLESFKSVTFWQTVKTIVALVIMAMVTSRFSEPEALTGVIDNKMVLKYLGIRFRFDLHM